MSRDDRAISENGKEVRYPFLNKNLVQKVRALDFRLLTDFYQEKGKGGDKILLRKLAAKLGLTETSTFSKKAI